MAALSHQPQLIVCLRCGRGFVLTEAYLNLLERQGAKAVTPVQCPTCFYAKGPLPKRQGVVKWFSSHKRYGFIVTEEGEDAFFHENQLVVDNSTMLREGQAVRFHLHYPIKGPEALNVKLIEA
jgi:cold shock CspA family protein